MKLNRTMRGVTGMILLGLSALYLSVAAAFLLHTGSRGSEVGDEVYAAAGVFAVMLAAASAACGAMTLGRCARPWPWALLAGLAMALTLASLWLASVDFGWSTAAVTAAPMAFIAMLAVWRAVSATTPPRRFV
jgi:hypothetical protein